MAAKVGARAGRTQRELGLPLQTGTTALWCLSWAVPLIAFGLGSIALILAKAGLETGGLIFFPIVACGAPAVFGFYGLALARGARPSDLVLGAEGLRVAGGPDDGVMISWVEIDPTGCVVTPERRVPTLLVRSRVGENIALGRAYARSERASLESLASTLAALAGIATRNAEAPSADDSLRTFGCAGCGALAVAADAPFVSCAYCGAQVPIPEDVRERIRAAARLATAARAIDADVKILLARGSHLPKARAALFVSVAFVVTAWVLALGVGASGYVSGRIHAGGAALVLVAAALASTSFCALASGAFIDRLAVRLVSLDLAARAPRRAGEPHGCRACGCPLVELSGAVLATCTACGTTNVLGLDCRRESKIAKAQAEGLEDAMRARRATALRWRLLGLGGAIASAGAALAVLAVAVWRG